MRYDAIIIGAGAAGLFCAGEAGRYGKRTLVLDHASKPAEKVRISGGGRCNFTNIHASPAKGFLSSNPHFAKSALARYTPSDFLELVEAHGIAWHEKTLGQLFCDRSAKDIIDMLLSRCADASADVRLSTPVQAVRREGAGFVLSLAGEEIETGKLVIATGGLSIPKMGATGFAYDLARRFGHALVETRAGLVPFTLEGARLEPVKALAGVATPVRVSCGGTSFDEALLFTHRGLSGPAVLQISSYWRPGETVEIDLFPGMDAYEALRQARTETPRQGVASVLARTLPKRLADWRAGEGEARLADQSDKALKVIADGLNHWALRPDGTEGYRRAEVTLGGVCTSGLSSKTMESRIVPGLYFIGECVDVTGWLGGYNFQWAWASAAACAQTL